jgi:hypothetical protein
MYLNQNFDPLKFQRAYFVHSLINLNKFYNLDALIENLQNLF